MDQNQIINTSLTVLSVILTGFYVILTLIIVRKTAEAIALTRKQIDINKEQSDQATALSEKQSKAATDTVRDQIKASEKQAQEALYNQHKPVIIPVNTPISREATTYTMDLQNKGTGVAFNTWGLLTIKGLPLAYHFVQTYFLVPDMETGIGCTNGDTLYPTNVFENYVIYPPDDASGIHTDLRLMVTYNDAFDNKYLVIFDHSDEFGWRQVALQRVDKRLDEMAVKRKAV
jgi:hypothetical protein